MPSAAHAEAAWGEDVFGGGDSATVSGDVKNFSDAAFVIDSAAAVGDEVRPADDTWDESVFSEEGGAGASAAAAVMLAAAAREDLYSNSVLGDAAAPGTEETGVDDITWCEDVYL